MVFTAKELSVKQETAASPVLKIKNNLLFFLFQAELDRKSSCNIISHMVRWKHLDGTIFSENPKYNNLTFSLTQEQLKHLNDDSHNNEQVLNFLLKNFMICPQIEKLSFNLVFVEPEVLMVPYTK